MRTDATIGYTNDWTSSTLTYSQIAAQPDYGYPQDREEIQAVGSVKLRDYITASAR